VGIDKAGKNSRIAEVMNFVVIRYLIRSNDILNSLALYKDGARANSFGRDHAARDESLQLQNVSSSGFAIPCDENSILRNSASSLYSLLSEAAAKESMSTDLRVRGLLAPATP
jgi:hypothetical protein